PGRPFPCGKARGGIGVDHGPGNAGGDVASKPGRVLKRARKRPSTRARSSRAWRYKRRRRLSPCAPAPGPGDSSEADAKTAMQASLSDERSYTTIRALAPLWPLGRRLEYERGICQAKA